jgi:RNA polymerase sigma-70 factor (ECF subfamily)
MTSPNELYPGSGSPAQPENEPILDGFAERLIRHKARQLARLPGFTWSDRDCIEQELRLKLLKHAASYDPQQGHRHAFVTALVQRQAANVLRAKRAEKRDHRHVHSLSAVVAADKEEGPVVLADTISRRHLDARLGRATREEHELAALAMDVHDVIASLPPELGELARRLKTDSLSQIARDLGIPRTTLADRVRKLRRYFEQAGLRDYL